MYSPGHDSGLSSQVELPQLSPNPSPSKSDHWRGFCGKASAPLSSSQESSGLEYPSSSKSRQPCLSKIESPDKSTQSSALTPSMLSPNPSPSVSDHWVGSKSKASSTLAHPSPSLSKHPIFPLAVELPNCRGQVSVSSDQVSPSESAHPCSP